MRNACKPQPWLGMLLSFASLATPALYAQVPLSSVPSTTTSSASAKDDVLEGTRLRPSLEVGASYTDNFFFAPDSGNSEDGSGIIVRPELTLSHATPRLRIISGASGEFGWFDLPGNADDYADGKFSLGGDWQPAARHRFSLTSAARYDHDSFGLERTENTPLENREIDKWRQVAGQVSYLFGIPDDRFNFGIRIGGHDKVYTNNRDVTRYLDHHITSAQLLGYYNLGPKTSLYGSVTGLNSQYDEVAPGAFDRSATTMRYLLGTRWKATAKSSGDIQLGYVSRNPDDPDRDDFRRFDWEATMNWMPRPVREFKLATGRQGQESYLAGADFIDNRYASLSWIEQWSPRFQTDLTGRYVESAFIGMSRVDDSVRYSLLSEYLVTRNFKLIGLASNDQRDSDAGFANYERLYVYLGARYAR